MGAAPLVASCAASQDPAVIRAVRAWLRRWWWRWRRARPKYLPGAVRLVHGRWHDAKMAEDHR